MVLETLRALARRKWTQVEQRDVKRWLEVGYRIEELATNPARSGRLGIKMIKFVLDWTSRSFNNFYISI